MCRGLNLGEVADALRRLPGVSDAAVLARPDRDDELVLTGYAVPAHPGGGPGLAITLREQLRQRLPAAAVPATVQLVDDLPLDPNGKLDAAALPRPADPPVVTAAPALPLERVVADVWKAVLGRAEVGVDDDPLTGIEKLQPR